MNYYVDENIKNTYRMFPKQGRKGFYRLDMNENPEGLPKDFVDSVLKEITPEFLASYPEADCFTNKYADFIGADYDNLLVTNGSNMGIRYIFETFGEKGKDIITVTPTFEMYRINCSILGFNHVPITYEDDFSLDINKILNAISKNTRIVVLLNPNNPMGNVYTDEEIKKVINKTKEVGAILVIDEAYHYFYDKTFINYALTEENVIILRTFSKLMSIASLRIGVVVSNPKIIEYIKNGVISVEVNSIALLFAQRIIENPTIIDDLIRIEREGKKYLIETLKANGYWCKDCMGNFVFVKPNHDARDVVQRLKDEKKVLVHPYNNETLKDYIRVTTGSKEMMKKFIDAFLDVDSK